MPIPPKPTVECEQEHVSFLYEDLRAALDFYTNKLGFREDFVYGDPPHIAGVSLGNVQMFLENGTAAPKGSSVYFVVGDVDALYEYHRACGVKVAVEIGDREYGLRDYRVHDLNGYSLSFGQRLWTMGEPIPIERVDVPVRLEKRLASLLADLATAKRMSLSSLFEETFLHTLDGVEPHTDGQLRQIQDLKKKHGIDYDSHGSYRFLER